jgi:hypothetical protein
MLLARGAGRLHARATGLTCRTENRMWRAAGCTRPAAGCMHAGSGLPHAPLPPPTALLSLFLGPPQAGADGFFSDVVAPSAADADRVRPRALGHAAAGRCRVAWHAQPCIPGPRSMHAAPCLARRPHAGAPCPCPAAAAASPTQTVWQLTAAAMEGIAAAERERCDAAAEIARLSAVVRLFQEQAAQVRATCGGVLGGGAGQGLQAFDQVHMAEAGLGNPEPAMRLLEPSLPPRNSLPATGAAGRARLPGVSAGLLPRPPGCPACSGARNRF